MDRLLSISEKSKSKSKEDRYLSRPHYKEEKKKQKREWLKRRVEEKRKQRRMKKAHGKDDKTVKIKDARPKTSLELDDNIAVLADLHQAEITIDQTTGNQRRDSVPVSQNVKAFSRGKQMLMLARLKSRQRPEISTQKNVKHTRVSVNGKTTKVSTVSHKSANRGNSTASPAMREINSSLMTKTLDKPIGSGTFGNVYLAEYRGMKTVVKEMKKRKDSSKESELCKRVLLNLGDHPNLPFLVGACTEKEPFFLVLQFHGRGEQSVTLHKVLKKRMFDKHLTAQVFHEISQTLKHIHGKRLM